MATFKYVNKNKFPVYLPTPRGGRKQFRPDDFDTDPWYSRFLGRNQLRKEPHDGSLEPASHHIAAPERRPSTKSANITMRQRSSNRKLPYSMDTQVGCAASCEVLCEQVVQSIANTEFGTRVGNKYFCKFCAFDTDDDGKMHKHIEAYHSEELTEEIDNASD